MTKLAPKPKLKIKPPVTPLTGNSFTYFVPKSSSSQTAHVKTAGKNGILEYKKPGSFITTNFKEVTKLKLHHHGVLPPRSVLRGADIICAALEGGYGRENLWTSTLSMKPEVASDLARYLLSRLSLVMSCLTRNVDKAISVKVVYSNIESSEKAALSFIIGAIGSYLAAQQWLKTGGDGLDLFLHAGIYAKAVNGAAPPVNFSPTSKKWPDYLVYSRKKDWHIFESKGGSINERWLRIVQGLTQLANLPTISWAGEPAQNVRTAVCVHSSVDANEPLHITLVDPPDQSDEKKEPVSVGLIQSVCRLLLVLESIDQFRGLVSNSRTRRVQYGNTTWLIGEGNIFGEFSVGIPSRYLDNERRLRRVVAIYLSAAEAWPGSVNENDFAERFGKKLVEMRHLRTDITSEKLSRSMSWYVSRVVEFFGKPDFLLETSRLLRMDYLSSFLMVSNEQKSMAQLGSERETAFTSGGMLISQ